VRIALASRRKARLATSEQRKTLGKYIGVDGCRAGWISVTDDGRGPSFRIFTTMRELLDASPEAELVLVDIPIGLPWRECPTRPCDFEARKLLNSFLTAPPLTFSPA
jgi:predicted RNase H-like nuclease